MVPTSQKHGSGVGMRLKVEDWLNDPLTIPDPTKLGWTIRRPNETFLPKSSWELWWSFHFATRLKLEGTVYFCSQMLGASSLPDELGLPLLVHRMGTWYAHAFFFELCSAYDTLLQEINVVYECGIDMDKVRWRVIKPKLPDELRSSMERRRNEDWFKEVFGFRNMSTHHYIALMEKVETGIGEEVWGLDVDEAKLVYVDQHTNNIVRRDIAVAKDYLRRMLHHVHELWERMSEKFE